MLIKLGESFTITSADLQSAENVLMDQDILSRFQKVATDLKTIAPKANDFLYFSAIMMSAAEASLYDDNGNLKKDASGKTVEARWEKKGESWRWVCSDSGIRPYKNNNGDIFPEEELIKAHKKWIGKPLCLDHKSSSVDMIRGVIVDTYYDLKNKRVIALCALDKLNYPDLARKVATGYAACVSMGTAVGRAICSDCGTVARIESEFCDHMRGKSCYGEINVDLNPIELSIVVNGADPKAKIRHIVAQADALAQYIQLNETRLAKMAEDETKDIELASKIETGLEQAVKDLAALKEMVAELKGNEEAEQEKYETAESKEDEEKKEASDKLRVNIVGSDNNLILQLKKDLASLREDFNNFMKISKEDTQMTQKTAYHLGGGGVNEPTPGKPKYEKEEADSIRNNQDKQMVGQMDTGPVDGMHPGYDSFGESEEARKKRLLRASEEDERAIRRQAALKRAKETLASKKEAYHLGGGGVNEPTPGKPKYEKEDSDKLREKEDKQMVGAPPFPGVGKVDGLHGDDEKVKKLHLRAKLTAKFHKAGKPDGSLDLGESRWQVYADDKIILSATVNEITGGRVEAMYDSVATRDFGKKIIETIRVQGFDKATSLFKGAAPAMPAAAPAPAPEAPAAPAMPAAPPADMAAPAAPEAAEEMPMDEGGSGNQEDNVKETLDELENNVAKMREGVEALLGESGNELDELEQMVSGGEELPASVAKLMPMRSKLSAELLSGMKQAIKELNTRAEELKLAAHIYQNKSMLKKADLGYVNELAASACVDARKALADTDKVKQAFVNYARGTEALVKEASKLSKADLKAKPGQIFYQGDPFMPLEGLGEAKKDAKGNTYYEYLGEGAKSTKSAPAKSSGSGMAQKQPAAKSEWRPLEQGSGSVRDLKPEELAKADDGKEDENDAMVKKPDGTEIKLEGDEVAKALAASKEPDMTTKEGRAQMRAKLAEKGMAFSDMLTKAHGKGGVTTDLDVKPSGDLGKVETLEETHKAMLDVAKAPPKVRKMAEDIQKLVVAGQIDPEKDFDSLIKAGLDSDAVKYWKAFWGQAKDGGSQFAAEFVKEHQAAKVAEEKETYRVKLSRAYELTYEMVRKGMVANDRHAINEQVNELMKFNDDGFNSMKRHVDNQTVKTASVLPAVGLTGVPEVVQTADRGVPMDLNEELALAFRGRRY